MGAVGKKPVKRRVQSRRTARSPRGTGLSVTGVQRVPEWGSLPGQTLERCLSSIRPGQPAHRYAWHWGDTNRVTWLLPACHPLHPSRLIRLEESGL